MIEANNSWVGQRNSAWQSDNLNCVTVDVTTKQPESFLAYVSPQSVPTNVGQNGNSFTGLPVEVGIMDKDELHAQNQQGSLLHPQTGLATPNLCPSDQLFLSSSRHDGKTIPHETSSSQQKKFFIFDHSGEEIRIILSSLRSPIRNPTAITAKPVATCKFPDDLHVSKLEQACPKAENLYEESHENHIIDEDSDFHEDTEEINALLYSDEDGTDDGNYVSEDEDEVSMGRSPLKMENGFEDIEEGKDFDDEVNSYACAPKRQKLLAFGSSGKLSSMAVETMEKLPPRLCEDESIVDMNAYGVEHPKVGSKRSRRDEIHNKLKILEKLLPGSKSKDPLVILDEAINYLKSLKVEANSLQVEDAESSCCYGPFL